MPKWRYWYLAPVAVIAVLAITVTTAAGGTRSRSAVSGTISVNIEVNSQFAFNILIKNFERVYPNVTVNPTYTPADARGALIATQFQAGNAPDVIQMAAGNDAIPSVWQYAAAGKLLDLSNQVWTKRIPSFLRPLDTYKGKIYAWTYRTVQSPVVIYNKSLFQSLGLKVPTTFGQLLTLCGTVHSKAPNLIPLNWWGSGAAGIEITALGLAANTVYGADPNWNAQRAAGKVTFQSTAGWRTALQEIVDMKNANCFPPGVASITAPVARASVAQGQSLMLFGNDPAAAYINRLNPNIQLGLIAFPGFTASSTYLNVIPADSFVVNKASKNIPAAEAFVAFIAREQENRLFSTIQGEVDPFDLQKIFNHPDQASKILTPIHQGEIPLIEKGHIRVFGPDFWPTPTSQLQMSTDIQGLLTGQETINDVLQAGDTNWGK